MAVLTGKAIKTPLSLRKTLRSYIPGGLVALALLTSATPVMAGNSALFERRNQPEDQQIRMLLTELSGGRFLARATGIQGQWHALCQRTGNRAECTNRGVRKGDGVFFSGDSVLSFVPGGMVYEPDFRHEDGQSDQGRLEMVKIQGSLPRPPGDLYSGTSEQSGRQTSMVLSRLNNGDMIALGSSNVTQWHAICKPEVRSGGSRAICRQRGQRHEDGAFYQGNMYLDFASPTGAPELLLDLGGLYNDGSRDSDRLVLALTEAGGGQTSGGYNSGYSSASSGGFNTGKSAGGYADDVPVWHRPDVATSAPTSITQRAPTQTASTSTRSQGNSSNDATVRAMQTALSQIRQRQGLSALTPDDALNRAARLHCEDMARHDDLSHDGSDGSRFWDRTERAGYNGQPRAENVAVGQGSVDEVVNSWMNSDGHRRNILLSDVREFGIGRVDNWWTLVLGRP